MSSLLSLRSRSAEMGLASGFCPRAWKPGSERGVREGLNLRSLSMCRYPPGVLRILQAGSLPDVKAFLSTLAR